MKIKRFNENVNKFYRYYKIYIYEDEDDYNDSINSILNDLDKLDEFKITYKISIIKNLKIGVFALIPANFKLSNIPMYYNFSGNYTTIGEIDGIKCTDEHEHTITRDELELELNTNKFNL
jgi:hypothetical protein